jgi:hypothetical protein
MKRKQAVIDLLATPRMSDEGRLCDAPACKGIGEFRAPQSRKHLTNFYWFCLDHVRAYNKQWNYYAGMNEAEVEQQIRFDTTWWRPTWPMGPLSSAGVRANWGGPHVHYGAFGQNNWDEQTTHPTHPNGASGAATAGWRPQPGSPEAKAVALFDLEAPVTLDDIKIRYKELVKRHHPDANGGDKEAEERLKVINQAYSTLLRSDDLKS